MKKIYSLLTLLVLLSSCSDMLEPNSDRHAIEPKLDAKGDSVFYAFGIAQAMQQVADQYFFQGEMRGDLVSTTLTTDNNLRQLADFSADLSNKYDSAYAYYKVINNCNYYIANRNTNLYTGATNVTTRELSAVHAYRAWAYLQLARNYGRVPFFTEPLTSISQIDNSQFPLYDINEITAALAPSLFQYSTASVPNYGTRPVGTPNWSSTTKNVATSKTFIPAAVILGDLYLESGQYAEAAQTYYQYLAQRGDVLCLPYGYQPNGSFMGNIPTFKSRSAEVELPADYDGNGNLVNPTGIYTDNTDEVISYIPMAVSRVNGQTTLVPFSFGFDYYALSNQATWQEDIQIVASDYYDQLTASQKYYYVTNKGMSGERTNSLELGDQRATGYFRTRTEGGTLEEESIEKEWINKFQGGNIILYRASTVYLHLAEALNRMGMPDLAFAILKEGICEALIADDNEWVTPESKEYLKHTFLNDVNKTKFTNTLSYGIHSRGCGVTYDRTFYGRKASADSYQYGTEVGSKLKAMAENAAFYPDLKGRIAVSEQHQALYKHDLAIELEQRKAYDEAKKQYEEEHADDPEADPYPEYETSFDPSDAKYASLITKEDTIMAVEELLCDEEAMELCFEGTRWYDLMRFARHKNRAGLPGNQWLADRLKFKSPAKSLESEDNWYLPFK